jgi:hypothetical protein
MKDRPSDSIYLIELFRFLFNMLNKKRLHETARKLKVKHSFGA